MDSIRQFFFRGAPTYSVNINDTWLNRVMYDFKNALLSYNFFWGLFGMDVIMIIGILFFYSFDVYIFTFILAHTLDTWIQYYHMKMSWRPVGWIIPMWISTVTLLLFWIKSIKIYALHHLIVSSTTLLNLTFVTETFLFYFKMKYYIFILRIIFDSVIVLGLGMEPRMREIVYNSYRLYRDVYTGSQLDISSSFDLISNRITLNFYLTKQVRFFTFAQRIEEQEVERNQTQAHNEDHREDEDNRENEDNREDEDHREDEDNREDEYNQEDESQTNQQDINPTEEESSTEDITQRRFVLNQETGVISVWYENNGDINNIFVNEMSRVVQDINTNQFGLVHISNELNGSEIDVNNNVFENQRLFRQVNNIDLENTDLTRLLNIRLKKLDKLAPTFSYQDDSDTRCSICQEDFKEKKSLCRRLPECKHIFHADCVDKWFALRYKCPNCQHQY
jgi:hypothetical protein